MLWVASSAMFSILNWGKYMTSPTALPFRGELELDLDAVDGALFEVS